VAHDQTGNPYGEKPVLPPLPRGLAPRMTRRGRESRAETVARAVAARARMAELMRRAVNEWERD